MRNTALATRAEYDDVPVSSTEVLEAHVAAIREGLNEFKSEVRAAFANITTEIKSLREKGDKHFERLSTKIDATNARIDATNQEVGQLSKTVIRTQSKLSALVWFWSGLGGIGGLITLITAVGKFFHWF